MTDACQTFTEHLAAQGPDGLDATSRAHADACAGCRAVLSFDRTMSNDLAAPTPLAPSAELAALMRAPVAPSRGFSLARRLAAPVVATVAAVSCFAVCAPRPDLAAQPKGIFVGAFALMVAVWCAAVALALARGRAGVGVRGALQGAAVAAAIATFTVTALGMTLPVEGSLPDNGLPGMWHCGTFSVIVGAALGVVMFRAARRSAVVSPAATGALLGVASGLGGALVLHWICGVASPLHVLLGHGVALAVGAGVGALLGRRVVAV